MRKNSIRKSNALRASEQHRYGLEISCLKPHLDNFSRNHTGAGGKYMCLGQAWLKRQRVLRDPGLIDDPRPPPKRREPSA